MSIKISADSTCDLSAHLISHYDIGIVPLYVILEGKAYRDGMGISPDAIFSHVENGGKIASTAAVNVEDYNDFFSDALREHEGVVHFTISSEMSSCYQNACLSASEMKNVYVVDSRNLSTGIGQLVIEAALMAEAGNSAEEIFRAMEEKKKKLDVSFVINTLEYLRMGGRCSTLAAMGANLLSLKPCIEVKDGSMHVGKKYRGQLDRCLMKYIADHLADADSIDDSRIFITDSGVSEEVFERVKAEVLRHVPFKEVHHTRAGCTISNHCGPNCLGILFFRK